MTKGEVVELEHSFTVPVAVDDAWKVLRDVERVAPCIPGGSIDSVEGEQFTGQVKVKVGAIQVTYKGSARFSEVDEDNHAATIEASGQERRGSGTAQATVRATMTGTGEETEVRMVTDLAITGKPAQFGRGTMADVGSKLITQFADCLAEELAGGGEPEPSPEPEPAVASGSEPPAEPAAAATETSSPRRRPADEPIDLLQVGGAPVARRIAPVAGGVLVLVLLVSWLVRRRRR